MNEKIQAIEDMCLLVDEFAKSDITPETPLYNFQQEMIENVKRYREKKFKENTDKLGIYPLYRFAKRIIENGRNDDEDLIYFREAIKSFDSLGRGYAERYAKEKENDRPSEPPIPL